MRKLFILSNALLAIAKWRHEENLPTFGFKIIFKHDVTREEIATS